MAVVLVTGCSGGFGRATALAFARRGARVYATVRQSEDAASLEAQASREGLKLRAPILDLNDRDAIDRVTETLDGAPVEVLVNNAGIAIPGTFEDTDCAAVEHLMRVNFFGPVWLTRALLPEMRAAGRGRIIMVSSLSALVGLPGDGYYAASKAALEVAAESLRHEVDAFGIRVSVVEPGLFNTAMAAKSAAAAVNPPGSSYGPLMDHLTRHAAAAVGRGDDPQLVANAIVAIAEAEDPPFRTPIGGQAEQVVATLRRLNPSQRDKLIKQVNDTAWWSSREPPP